MSKLKKIPLLAEFDEEDRAALAELLEEQDLAVGQLLFREGEEAGGLVLVMGGALEVESRRAGTLGTVGPGFALGGLSLVTPGTREANVTALEKTRVAHLDRFSFRRLVADSPRTACRLLEAVLAEFAAGVRPALARLAALPVDPHSAGD
jgi:CRP-like cAMP-binding protein